MVRYFDRATSTLVASIYIAFAAAVAIAATYGLESLRVVQAFDLDEYRILSLMQRHLDERSLDPHGFYIYGNFYDAIGYVVAHHVAVRRLERRCAA